jgi:hypothetical protein
VISAVREATACSEPSRTASLTTSHQCNRLVCHALSYAISLNRTHLASRRSKGAHIPPELQQFWIKDRLKKAERKRARERERLERAADPLSPHRGGKKARKAMLAAFNRADSPLADRPVDMEALADRLRTFAKARDGRQTLNLPPMRKEDRKMVHELALGFGLKSKSKGRDEARYTTLTKTRNSGSGAEEWRIHKVLRQVRGGAGTVYGQRGGKGKGRAPMQRDGEEVGKVRTHLAYNPFIRLRVVARLLPRLERRMWAFGCSLRWVG